MFTDDNGYEPRPEHLSFLCLTSDDLADCKSQVRPLGMTSSQFQALRETLNIALERDQLGPCDIRLKGSSAHFYSSPYKEMPWGRDQLAYWFRKTRRRVPGSEELDAVETRINDVWPSDQPRPRRRPFDSMHRIGIDRDPSDYDIQISSNEIATRAVELCGSLNITVNDETLISAEYDFIKKDIIEEVCPMLTRWALIQSDRLQRLVSIAAFPSGGPPDREKLVGKKSAHFRESDWVLK